ncbi:MAG: SPOR domain-containing protein [Crocosphaera sp.]|nr:SPOR domain-containing protein [Crocosphaera sp.]
MSEKDNWDKFEILFKLVILGAIPIVIGVAGDNIAQSLKRGELIKSLITDLSSEQSQTSQTRRDIALITLDESIPPRKKCKLLWVWWCKNDVENDPVVKIAVVLVNTSIGEALRQRQKPEELTLAKEIISGVKRGNLEYYQENFGDPIEALKVNAQPKAISNVDGQPKSDEEIEDQANISQTIAAIQPSPEKSSDNVLKGIRLVYIQYGENKEQAKKLQTYLRSQGISAPGIEQISGIKNNDIRYSNAADKEIAEKLQNNLKENQDIEFEELRDLSEAGYRVPSGQFEIWLK